MSKRLKSCKLLHNIVKAQQIAAEQGAAIRGVIQGSLNIGSYYSVSAAWLPNRSANSWPGLLVPW